MKITTKCLYCYTLRMMHFSLLECCCFGCNTIEMIGLRAFHKTHLIMSTFFVRLMLSVLIHQTHSVYAVCALCVPVQQTLTLFMVFVQRTVEPVCATQTYTHTHTQQQHAEHSYICTHPYMRVWTCTYNVSYHTIAYHYVPSHHACVYYIHTQAHAHIWFCI